MTDFIPIFCYFSSGKTWHYIKFMNKTQEIHVFMAGSKLDEVYMTKVRTQMRALNNMTKDPNYSWVEMKSDGDSSSGSNNDSAIQEKVNELVAHCQACGHYPDFGSWSGKGEKAIINYIRSTFKDWGIVSPKELKKISELAHIQLK